MSIEVRRRSADDGLTLVGLIGRTGSGKSTVAQVLAEQGAQVLEGDALGHAVTDQDPEVRAALSDEYGAQIYRPDGTLDRAQVAARIFRDAEARARLDRLVHPRIVARIGEWIERLRHEGYRGVAVIDAALLLEWGLERWCDAVIAVVAPQAEQVARLQAARGWSEDEALRRLDVQRSDAGFAAAADVTLENNGSLRDLERAAQDAMARLIERHASRGRATGNPPC